MQIIAEGLDPTIGMSHSTEKYRDVLVLDRMEPLRPIVDGCLLKLVQNTEFFAGDFTITTVGHCRLNPPMVRKIVATTSSKMSNEV